MIRNLLLASAALLGVIVPAAAMSTGHQTAYPGGHWEPGPARYGSVIGEVAIKMDDGIVLKASVAWPTDLVTGKRATGRFPVVVEQTPYTRLQAPVAPLPFFPQHGYIHLVVHARGTGPSGGDVQYVSPRDGEDGRAVVDWAAHRLDGSDGRLALVGCSYPAGLALMTAAHLPAGSPVKAIVAGCNGFESQNRGSFMRSGLDTGNVATMREGMASMLGDTPSAKSFFPRIADEVQAGDDAAYDGAFWQQRLATPLAKPIVASGIPILLWSGWRDHVEGALRTWTALQNVAAGHPAGGPMMPDQLASPRYQLVMGDAAHAKGLDLGVFLEWIETWLKRAQTGIDKTTTPLHVRVVGSARWVNLSRLPIVQQSEQWFLAPGTLSRQPPQHDETMLTQAAYRTPLRFETPAFTTTRTLAGPMSLSVAASSSNTNLLLVARLFDVATDGSATEIATGSVLGSQSVLDDTMTWREADGAAVWPWPRLARDTYLQPDRESVFDIALGVRMWDVQSGHHLRLEIGTQAPDGACGKDAAKAYPRTNHMYPCQLNEPQQRTVPGGTYRLRYGPGGSSSLRLPIIASNGFAQVRTGLLPTGYDEGSRSMVRSATTLPLDW